MLTDIQYTPGAEEEIALQERHIKHNIAADVDGAPVTKELEAWKPSKRVKLVVASLCFLILILSLDVTILTVTLPASLPPARLS